MKRLLPIVFLLVLLAGCTSHPDAAPTNAPQATNMAWTPPESLVIDLGEEAQSVLYALDLCRAFALEMSLRFPDYAPVLSDADIAYYEKHLREPDVDIDALSSELAATIVQLRHQVYLRMEETTKVFKPLPDGLEQFVRDFEARFQEIGW